MVKRHPLPVLVWLLLATGCAPSLHSRGPLGALMADRDAETARCASAWREVDDAIDLAGVRDGEAFRVPGQPWLRTTRTLAGLARAGGADAAALIDRMRLLDADARALELANLSEAALDGLAKRLRLSGSAAVADLLSRCGTRLHERTDVAAALATTVPDDSQACCLFPVAWSAISATLQRCSSARWRPWRCAALWCVMAPASFPRANRMPGFRH